MAKCKYEVLLSYYLSTVVDIVVDDGEDFDKVLEKYIEDNALSIIDDLDIGEYGVFYPDYVSIESKTPIE